MITQDIQGRIDTLVAEIKFIENKLSQTYWSEFSRKLMTDLKARHEATLMRFIAAKTLLSVEEIELTLEPLSIPKHAQQSTLEWVKNRNKMERNHG
jgi:hypothetical protein